MKLFKEHAESTNDIFLVAAQAVANTLITARAALPSGKQLAFDLCSLSTPPFGFF